MYLSNLFTEFLIDPNHRDIDLYQIFRTKEKIFIEEKLKGTLDKWG